MLLPLLHVAAITPLVKLMGEQLEAQLPPGTPEAREEQVSVPQLLEIVAPGAQTVVSMNALP